MKRYLALLSVVIMILTLAGCGKASYPDLPDNATAFEMGTFIDPNDDGAKYGTIDYEGRTYIGYGTLGKSLHKKDIAQCVGYIVMDENSSSIVDLSDRSIRIYTLSADTEHNYLMEYDTSSGIMNQPAFLRAIDTLGTDIPTPGYISSLEYSCWD